MKKMTLGTGAAIAGGLLALAVLAGCHKSERDEPPAETENVQDADESREVEAPPALVEKPAPKVVAPTPPNTVEAAEPPIAPDVQMLDDADATGMTARMPSADEAGDYGNGSLEQ